MYTTEELAKELNWAGELLRREMDKFLADPSRKNHGNVTFAMDEYQIARAKYREATRPHTIEDEDGNIIDEVHGYVQL